MSKRTLQKFSSDSSIQNQDTGCNCKKKDKCLLENSCLTQSVIYKASVKTEGIPDEKFTLVSQKAPLKSDFTITS